MPIARHTSRRGAKPGASLLLSLATKACRTVMQLPGIVTDKWSRQTSQVADQTCHLCFRAGAYLLPSSRAHSAYGPCTRRGGGAAKSSAAVILNKPPLLPTSEGCICVLLQLRLMMAISKPASSLLGQHWLGGVHPDFKWLGPRLSRGKEKGLEGKFFFGSDQNELALPAHFTVLEVVPRNQGSELSSATMIPQIVLGGGGIVGAPSPYPPFLGHIQGSHDRDCAHHPKGQGGGGARAGPGVRVNVTITYPTALPPIITIRATIGPPTHAII